MRSLALAQVWQDRGGKVIFCMAHCTTAIHDRLRLENCEVVRVPNGAADVVETIATAQRCQSEYVVLDGYSFGSEFQTHVHAGGSKVLYIDDLQQCESYRADIVLNPNLTASESRYLGRVNARRLLLGTGYCLLRKEFRCWDQRSRKISAPPLKVLVTLGGSTPEELAVFILEALVRIGDVIEGVVFVLGGSSGKPASLPVAAKKLGNKVIFQIAVSDMATLMQEADIAIAAAGSTCWELCYLGLPSLLVDVADNQTAEALALKRGGYANYLSRADAFHLQTLSEAIFELVRSEKRRRDLSIRSRTLVDGRGPERVVSAMLNLGSESEHSVSMQEVRP